MQNDIATEISREMFVEFIKQGIKATYPSQVAEIYCQQVDDAKMMAKLLTKLIEEESTSRGN